MSHVREAPSTYDEFEKKKEKQSFNKNASKLQSGGTLRDDEIDIDPRSTSLLLNDDVRLRVFIYEGPKMKLVSLVVVQEERSSVRSSLEVSS